jgi:hypothetical protein
MRIQPANCPVCGEIAHGTLDTIPGVALLMPNEDSSFDWAGETEVFWDGQTTDLDAEGRATVRCSNGHSWEATLVYEDREARE